MRPAAIAACALALLLALCLLCLAWEWRLAPLRPGGSWLALKALPLLAAVRGIARARRYTCQWSALLVLAYLCEGIVRGLTEQGPARILAVLEAALALAFFACALACSRSTAPRPMAPSPPRPAG